MPAAAPTLDRAALQAKAKTIRKHIINCTTTAGSGHPTSSMSGVEIAVALYFGGILRYDPKNPHWPQRDRFILSKGHASPLLYSVLAEAGYFSPDLLISCFSSKTAAILSAPASSRRYRRRGISIAPNWTRWSVTHCVSSNA